ncbi:hypothetical protein [Streptomyces albidochromogenes]|uniref:2-dehydropantoate 2-reductase n=1 Tax=Streptomyces albidochromogenes TaxID=329524 RepID=A0ABW6FVM0_9ACTN
MSELEQAAPLDIMFLQNGMAHIPVLEKWQTGHRIYTGSVEHRSKSAATARSGRRP